ncbi:hypothetical protein SDC9_176518 [bioreactor metagenome]|uniref:Uncharacterized protein n=1 Tax=bioreactor metagenome TaxID=1076179 RepID=A0A645GS21_9ZZZZ
MDAVFARLIAGGGHHPAATRVAADHQRQPGEARIVANLHRREKRVHVNMDDFPHGAESPRLYLESTVTTGRWSLEAGSSTTKCSFTLKASAG